MCKKAIEEIFEKNKNKFDWAEVAEYIEENKGENESFKEFLKKTLEMENKMKNGPGNKIGRWSKSEWDDAVKYIEKRKKNDETFEEVIFRMKKRSIWSGKKWPWSRIEWELAQKYMDNLLKEHVKQFKKENLPEL